MIVKGSRVILDLKRKNNFYDKYPTPFNEKIFGFAEIMKKDPESEYSKEWKLEYMKKVYCHLPTVVSIA